MLERSIFIGMTYTMVPMVVQALELLVEKCAMSIEGPNKSASSIILRVFECVASGLLLEGIDAWRLTYSVFTTFLL